jgi:cation transport ATPase
VEGFHAIPGKGVEAKYNGRVIMVSNRKLLSEEWKKPRLFKKEA